MGLENNLRYMHAFIYIVHFLSSSQCNNPQTKEPKLDRAIRIAPEWTEYDDIIRKLQEEMTTKQQANDSKFTNSH